MLQISKPLYAGAEQYWLELGREDYYLKGGEPPGKWSDGELRLSLGLPETVSGKDLKRLMRGLSPKGKRLVKNALKSNRQSGWDLVFSAPKTVSIAWAISDSLHQKAIGTAHDKAVRHSLKYLERVAGYGRLGKGGKEWVPAKLIHAVFEHSTSRSVNGLTPDMQLHSHAILLNLGLLENGETRAIVSSTIFANKMAAGALYRAALAYELEKLGFQTAQDGTSFRIVGIPEAVAWHFSKRREEIEKWMSEHEAFGAKNAKLAAESTRDAKDKVFHRNTLQKEWREICALYGLAPKVVGGIASFPPASQMSDTELAAIVEGCLSELTELQNYFGEHDLVELVSLKLQISPVDPDRIHRLVRKALASHLVVRFTKKDGLHYYTTRELIDSEEQLLFRIEQGRHDECSPVPFHALTKATASAEFMSDEQRHAIDIATGTARVSAISGLAGTGKTTALRCTREALQRAGYNVIGAGPTGQAAIELSESAGIHSSTLHRLLNRINSGRTKLSKRSALILDECSMVDNRMLSEILLHAEVAGARVLLVGDPLQLQAVGRGGGFAEAIKRLPESHLTTIRRQQSEWYRKAVSDVVEGKMPDAIATLEENGALKYLFDSSGEVAKHLIDEWLPYGVENPRDNVIIATKRADVRKLNELAQHWRHDKLGQHSLRVGQYDFHAGDRVVLKRNHGMQFVNGDTGTIRSLGSSTMTVELDRGPSIAIDLRQYQDIELGYARTAHSLQGAGRERVFLFLSDSFQDRELFYVQLSRGIQDAKLYFAPEPPQTGWYVKERKKLEQAQEKAREQLARLLEDSRQQQLATIEIQRQRAAEALERERAARELERQQQQRNDEVLSRIAHEERMRVQELDRNSFALQIGS